MAAYATLLTNTSYLPGVLILDHSLRLVQSKYPLVVMITPSLPQTAVDVLHKRGITTILVQSLVPDQGRFNIAADERFADTWTKLRAFSLLDYQRIVLLDADMLVRRNMDELMSIHIPDGHIAACHVCACNPRKLPHYPPDWIPSNCAHSVAQSPSDPPPLATETTPKPYRQLNSGTVVLTPSIELANELVHFLSIADLSSYIFPDQDLLTEFFVNKWMALPWYFNALKTLKKAHPLEWSEPEIRCLHYILHDKPWNTRVPPEGTGSPFDDLNRWWWDSFDTLGDVMRETDPIGWQSLQPYVNNKPHRLV